jgi:hypothetical protein
MSRRSSTRSTTSTISPSIRRRCRHLLELTIIFILALELLLVFMGIMK